MAIAIVGSGDGQVGSIDRCGYRLFKYDVGRLANHRCIRHRMSLSLSRRFNLLIKRIGGNASKYHLLSQMFDYSEI